MILQIDRRFSVLPEIQTYGCHYLAQLFIMNKLSNIALDTDIIMKSYNELRGKVASYQPEDREKGDPLMIIGNHAEINNPDDIVTYFGMKYVRPVKACKVRDS